MLETTVMLELHVISQKTGQIIGAFALGDATEILVGRDQSCDICIAASSISREHCVIEHIDGILTLRDLNSSGGTLHNGKAIDEIRLAHGLEVMVGPTLLRFCDS
jgi:pSer/pThr/pTyr-binding forkhead associated (FHA) protein|tara:strand:- start:604 stop:918 length:315 start_codon:yes stop_codon:yes gene_type:complete